MLPFLISNNLGVAGSFGTITYDLVSAAAEQTGAGLLLVVPAPLETLGALKTSPLRDAASFPRSILTCMAEAVICPKATRMVCRDRLLALVSDLHCVLELRRRGNLLEILEMQQREQVRPLWVYRPAAGTRENEGNLKLLEDFPQSAAGFSIADFVSPEESPAKRKTPHHTLRLLDANSINWQDYLYHYVRSCSGPWPGQSYRDFLMGLFRDDFLAGHTALEALVRVLVEGRIRAGSRIVRGNHAVISWTSRPPAELDAIRRWNPALIRWTFEPYGVAVRRRVLRELGAKPAIYGSSAVYARLRPGDRFRFQLHEPPRCSWKIEREWRLPRDLELAGIGSNEAFAFVPAAPELTAMEQEIFRALPIVVLGDEGVVKKTGDRRQKTGDRRRESEVRVRG